MKKWFSNHPTNSNIKIIDADTGTIEVYLNNKTWVKRKLGNSMTQKMTDVVADDYRFFFEKYPNVFDHKFIDNLMKKIGRALGWDLDHGTYVYEDDRMITQEQYEQIATDIYNQTRQAILNSYKK